MGKGTKPVISDLKHPNCALLIICYEDFGQKGIVMSNKDK